MRGNRYNYLIKLCGTYSAIAIMFNFSININGIKHSGHIIVDVNGRVISLYISDTSSIKKYSNLILKHSDWFVDMTDVILVVPLIKDVGKFVGYSESLGLNLLCGMLSDNVVHTHADVSSTTLWDCKVKLLQVITLLFSNEGITPLLITDLLINYNKLNHLVNSDSHSIDFAGRQ